MTDRVPLDHQVSLPVHVGQEVGVFSQFDFQDRNHLGLAALAEAKVGRMNQEGFS